MPDIKPVFSNMVVWRAETPRPDGLDRTEVYVNGMNCVVGIVPLSQSTSYIYIGEETDDASYRDNGTLHLQMRDLLSAFGGRVKELAPTIDSPEKVSCRPVHRMIVPAPWHRGRVVIIGDAVHVHSPSLAQGAAMAIEDAVVLAQEVALNPQDVASALDSFNARRHPRAAAVVDASTRLSGASSLETVARIRTEAMNLLAEPL